MRSEETYVSTHLWFQLRQEDHKFQASLGKAKPAYYVHIFFYVALHSNDICKLNWQGMWRCFYLFIFKEEENLSIAYKQAYLYTSTNVYGKKI